MPSALADSYPRLLGDIGGTNTRLALLRRPGAPIEALRTLGGANFAGPAEAIEAYLAEVGGERPRTGAIGIANPVVGDEIRMTNHFWAFSIEALRWQLGLQQLLFVNDFTALALALPSLPADERRQVGGGAAHDASPIAVLGPGTGLGVSGLIPTADGFVPLAGEGGHVTLAACDAEEAALIEQVRADFPHVSAERLISGPGLEILYQALAVRRGLPAPPCAAAAISTGALAGTDELAVDALNLFCALLGTVAGNLALTLGARGGVFIGGGIVPQLGDFFLRSPFRRRFEDKGRFRGYLEQVPVWVILATCPALRGAAVALEQALQRR